jgi:hypothetical protein
LARSRHRDINKSYPILALFFFEVNPQIEKYLSIQELEDLMFKIILANLLKSGYLAIFFIQNAAVDYIS